MTESTRPRRSRKEAGLSAQLTKSAPEVETFQALLVFGLQEDFLSPDGPLAVNTSSGFVDRILDLVPKFRDRAGLVMWIRSESAAEEAADALVGAGKTVKKFFSSFDNLLDRTSGPDGMMPGEQYYPSDFTEPVKKVVNTNTDIVVDKRHCSPFTSTYFQTTLYQNFIGDIFVCGCISELAIYAFARDAASKALRLHVIEDCLGYRNRSRNDFAVRRILAHMNGTRITSAEIHAELDRPLQATANADELADMMSGIMTASVGSEKKEERTESKREVRAIMMEESVTVALPSGILQKKKSMAKIYTRKPRRSNVEATAEMPQI